MPEISIFQGRPWFISMGDTMAFGKFLTTEPAAKSGHIDVWFRPPGMAAPSQVIRNVPRRGLRDVPQHLLHGKFREEGLKIVIVGENGSSEVAREFFDKEFGDLVNKMDEIEEQYALMEGAVQERDAMIKQEKDELVEEEVKKIRSRSDKRKRDPFGRRRREREGF